MVMKVVHLKMAVHADDTAGDESGSSVLNKKTDDSRDGDVE